MDVTLKYRLIYKIKVTVLKVHLRAGSFKPSEGHCDIAESSPHPKPSGVPDSS